VSALTAAEYPAEKNGLTNIADIRSALEAPTSSRLLRRASTRTEWNSTQRPLRAHVKSAKLSIVRADRGRRDILKLGETRWLRYMG
jgi:hypothetical protein